MVEDMEARMTNREFMRWSVYYARQAQRRDLDQKMARRGR